MNPKDDIVKSDLRRLLDSLDDTARSADGQGGDEVVADSETLEAWLTRNYGISAAGVPSWLAESLEAIDDPGEDGWLARALALLDGAPGSTAGNPPCAPHTFEAMPSSEPWPEFLNSPAKRATFLADLRAEQVRKAGGTSPAVLPERTNVGRVGERRAIICERERSPEELQAMWKLIDECAAEGRVAIVDLPSEVK